MALITDLVAYYKFDETVGAVADDAHTGSYDGDITGALINQTGKIDKAYDFDGVSGNDDVDLTNNAIWNTTFGGSDKKWSISCWIKPSATGGMFFAKLSDTGMGDEQRQFYLRVRSTNDRILIFYYCTLTGTIYRGIQGDTVLAVDGSTWYHVVITYDGSLDTNDGLDRVQIYVNGNAETETIEFTAGTLGDIQLGTARTSIGSALSVDGATSAYNHDGLIDEVGIWSRVLSSSEALSLYNSGSGLAYPFSEIDISYEDNGGIFAEGDYSVTVDFPATVNNYDICIVQLLDADNDTFTVPTGDGWNLIDEDGSVSSASTCWMWKRCNGTEGGGSQTFTSLLNAGSGVYGVISRYSGCIRTGTPYEGKAMTGVLQDTTATIPACTTLGAKRLVCAFITVEDNVSVAEASGYTEDYELQSDFGGDACLELQSQEVVSADTIASETAALGGDDYHGVLVLALIPEPTVTRRIFIIN